MSEKKLQMPPEEPTTLTDWLWRVRQYENSIYIREEVNGHWKTLALGSLPPERWAAHVARMFENSMNPVRLLDKEAK